MTRITCLKAAVAIVLCAVFAFAASSQAGSQMTITFSGYTGLNATVPLTNFPALVKFENGVGGSDFDFGTYPFVEANGYDLRFFDENDNPLPYEIDTFIVDTALFAWVRVPEILPDGSTSITAKWGDPNVTAQLPCTHDGSVWGADYHLVQHYNDIENGAVNDATDSGRKGVIREPSNVPAAGVIGAALNLSENGAVNGMNLSPGIAIGTECTISVWFAGLRPASQGHRTLIRSNNHCPIVTDWTNARLGTLNYGPFFWAEPAEIHPQAYWQQLAAVCADNKIRFYMDGVFIGEGTFFPNDWFTGLAWDTNYSYKFADYLDEFRIVKRAVPEA